MKGIYCGEILIEQLLWILVISGIIREIYPICVRKELNDNNTGSKDNKRVGIRDIIQLVVFISTIFIVVLGGLHVVISFELKVISFIGVMIGCIFCGLALMASVAEFIQFIFLNPYEYHLTKEKEDTIWLTGFLAYAVCCVLVKEETGRQIVQHIADWEAYWKDIVNMILLIFWYFSVIFFSLCFWFISLQKIILIIKYKAGLRDCHIGNPKKLKPSCVKIEFTNKIQVKLNSLPKNKWVTKTILNIIWLISVVLECLVLILVWLLDMFRAMMYIIFKIIPMILINKLKSFSHLLEKDLGKGIIFSSRISLVSSLLIVFLIDKYQKILSESGSEVYEFFCSVLIIPFLITQLSELRKRKEI